MLGFHIKPNLVSDIVIYINSFVDLLLIKV